MNVPLIKLKLSVSREQFDFFVDTEFPAAGVIAIFGQSGCGKTTLLRCIAGLEKEVKGTVQYGETTWQSEKKFLPTHKRNIGYVFQEASLFSHLSVKQNLEYGLKRSVKQDIFKIEFICALMGIEKLVEKYPAQLSGGERQRVAISRALLAHPDVLLMDEPLAALDKKRKNEILPYLDKIKQECNLPIIYVSHSPDEIARLADYIITMENGKITNQGNAFEMLTSANGLLDQGEEASAIVHATVVEKDTTHHMCKVAAENIQLWLRDTGHRIGESVRIRILARDVSIATQPPQESSIINLLKGNISGIYDDQHPGLKLISAKVSGHTIVARISSRSLFDMQLAIEQEIWLQIKSVAIVQ